MTAPAPERRTIVKVVRRLLAPAFTRIDAVRDELAHLHRRWDELAARIDQLSRQTERLEAYQQVSRDEVRDAFASLTTALEGTPPDAPPGEILQRRLDHALLHAEALTDETRRRFERELAELRSAVRLAQALAERATKAPAPTSQGTAQEPAPGSAPAPERAFDHPVPSFDLLYRSFEDRHRGDVDMIRERQREDYLDVLAGAPNPELPIADLGCGRGELVGLLAEEGHPVVGVDSNLGQVIDADANLLVEADLFDWLDEQDDASLRAVVAMHVVEHLPLDLQIRLVFESRRVLAEGGLMILETPNTLSLSTAATNFWVDPTHERPVHPSFLEFLAEEAGFEKVHTRLLHELPVSFPSNEATAELVADLQSLILGAGDIALIAQR